jgi:TolA-binding protein
VNKLRIAGALLALSLPAQAGLFDDDEARRRIEMLRSELAQQGKDNEVRIQKLEDLIRNIGVVELVRQLQQQNEEIARLRGQLEVIGNENQQIQKRQRDFYLDLDSRIKRLEAAGPGGAAAAPATPPPATGAPAAATPAPAAAVPAQPSATSEPGTGAPRVSSREDQAKEVRAYDAASTSSAATISRAPSRRSAHSSRITPPASWRPTPATGSASATPTCATIEARSPRRSRC